MNVYKLHYTNKEGAIIDLIAKEVYTEELEFGQGIKAIVDIGLIVLTEQTFDEDGNELTKLIYAEGYHFDIMSEQEIEFTNAIVPNNPKYTFA
jgi:hypothetical protein